MDLRFLSALVALFFISFYQQSYAQEDPLDQLDQLAKDQLRTNAAARKHKVMEDGTRVPAPRENISAMALAKLLFDAGQDDEQRARSIGGENSAEVFGLLSELRDKEEKISRQVCAAASDQTASDRSVVDLAMGNQMLLLHHDYYQKLRAHVRGDALIALNQNEAEYAAITIRDPSEMMAYYYEIGDVLRKGIRASCDQQEQQSMLDGTNISNGGE